MLREYEFGGMTMRCPNCGQRLADEAGRCPVCGTVIDEETRRKAMNEDEFCFIFI